MLTLYIAEKSTESKLLLEYAIKLKAPSKSIRIRRSKRVLIDEEMALPGIAPTAEELEQWILLPDGRGSTGEVSKKRLLKKFRQEFKTDSNSP